MGAVVSAGAVMGGNSPSHFCEEDEGGGITFLKGIRVSEGLFRAVSICIAHGCTAHQCKSVISCHSCLRRPF